MCFIEWIWTTRSRNQVVGLYLTISIDVELLQSVFPSKMTSHVNDVTARLVNALIIIM